GAEGGWRRRLRRSDRLFRLFPGDVSERPKEHAWKACVVQATAGSNPAVTAKRLKGSAPAGPFSRLTSAALQSFTPRTAPRSCARRLRTAAAPFRVAHRKRPHPCSLGSCPGAVPSHHDGAARR